MMRGPLMGIPRAQAVKPFLVRNCDGNVPAVTRQPFGVNEKPNRVNNMFENLESSDQIEPLFRSFLRQTRQRTGVNPMAFSPINLDCLIIQLDAIRHQPGLLRPVEKSAFSATHIQDISK